jgi:hypothetical protein
VLHVGGGLQSSRLIFVESITPNKSLEPTAGRRTEKPKDEL